MIVALMDFTYGDYRSMEEYALEHQNDHLEIRKAILDKGLANLPDYVLYPINWGNWDVWALRHQTAHNDENSALGLTDVDLTDVNFKDPRDAALWNFSHFAQHVAARTKLGI